MFDQLIHKIKKFDELKTYAIKLEQLYLDHAHGHIHIYIYIINRAKLKMT